MLKCSLKVSLPVFKKYHTDIFTFPGAGYSYFHIQGHTSYDKDGTLGWPSTLLLIVVIIMALFDGR